MNPSIEKQYPEHLETFSDELDPNLSLSIMADMVGENKRVLDIGCASGYFARLLKRRNCDVVGLDINPSALDAARNHCTETILADVEAAPLAGLIADRRFDVVVCGDVLEHLMNPVRILEEARGALADGGYLVASFPNIAHGAVRLSLLKGQFNYQDQGLLDDTHMRFFTLKTIDEMLLGAGYRIDRLERVTMDIFEREAVLPPIERAAFDEQVLAQIANDPEAKTLQFVVKAFALSDAARQKALFTRFTAVNTELANTRALLEKRETDVTRLSQSAADLAERVRALEAESRSDADFKIEHARLDERLRMTAAYLEDLRKTYEDRIAALEAGFAAQLQAEAAKTRAQADQIAAFIASGSAQTS